VCNAVKWLGGAGRQASTKLLGCKCVQRKAVFTQHSKVKTHTIFQTVKVNQTDKIH